MKSPLSKRIGMNICRLRTERGWTQEELAGKAGLDVSTVQRHESGVTVPSGVDVLKLAIALNVHSDEIYHGIPRDVSEVDRLHPRKARV